MTVDSVLPGLPKPIRQIVLAIGWLESRYGLTSDWQLPNGSPSYNWGALVYTGASPGRLDHGDKKADGTGTVYSFAAYNSAADGFRAFLATWKRADTFAAASAGNATATAAAMYGHGYFTGAGGTANDRIAAYAKAILSSAELVANTLGEPIAVTLGGSSGGLPGGMGTAVALGLAIAVAEWALLIASRRWL